MISANIITFIEEASVEDSIILYRQNCGDIVEVGPGNEYQAVAP